MVNPNHLKKPLLTEKSSIQRELNNTYVFEVAPKATKKEVKLLIEDLFKVEVKKVNVVTCLGKTKRVGKYEGKTRKRKKAYVSLKEGFSIEMLT